MVDVSTSAAGQVPTEQYVNVGLLPVGFAATPEETEAADEKIEQRLSKRRRPRREISGHDEASLSWHFGQGLAIYEKSTFGPIVQKIAMDGYTSTQCGNCDGQGTVEKGGVRLEDRCPTCEGARWRPHKKGEPQEWCITCDGSGVVTPYEVETLWGWCTSCRGTGSSCVERSRFEMPCHLCHPVGRNELGAFVPLVTARVPTHLCWNCYGSGSEPVTAFPLQVADAGGGVLANDSALTNFAITSRRLDKVKQRSPALYAALGAFYGDSGSRWALSDFGRLFALYHLTPAGQRLVRWERKALEKKQKEARKAEIKKAKKKGTITTTGKALGAWEQTPHLLPQEAIWTSAVAQQRQPHQERAKLLNAAHAEAQALLQRASEAWVSIAASKTERQRLKELAEKLESRGHERTAAILRLTSGGAR